MADLTATIKGADGKSPPKLLEAIGSFCQLIPFSVIGSDNSNAGPTTTLTFSALRSISGFICQARKIADGDLDDSDLGLITASGNTLTITEGAGGDAELHTYSGLVWGPAKL